VSKDKKVPEFTLVQYLSRQRQILHGMEVRAFKYIPKVGKKLTQIFYHKKLPAKKQYQISQAIVDFKLKLSLFNKKTS
jgi:hypothetical protein